MTWYIVSLTVASFMAALLLAGIIWGIVAIAHHYNRDDDKSGSSQSARVLPETSLDSNKSATDKTPLGVGRQGDYLTSHALGGTVKLDDLIPDKDEHFVSEEVYANHGTNLPSYRAAATRGQQNIKSLDVNHWQKNAPKQVDEVTNSAR